MHFKNHFDDISEYINESRSGTPIDVKLYGFNITQTVEVDRNPINFWASSNIMEGMESTWVGLDQPLVVEAINYEMGDIGFETQCIGFAVQHDYDSVIIETKENTFYMTIDFSRIEEYITEAGEQRLKGKTLPKRKELQAKRVKRTPKAPALEPEIEPTPAIEPEVSPTIKRPKKAPQTGIRVDVLLRNTGRLSPDRVKRGMKQVRKQPPKLTGVKDIQGAKYFRAEYNFKSTGSTTNQIGYADISADKTMCSEMFCTCADFFFRLYAPYVKAGLATWNVPPKYKSKQFQTVSKAPHNHKWTVHTNDAGKLFLCKHLWAFMAYYVAGDAGNVELSDEEIDGLINDYWGDVDGDGDEEEATSEFMKSFGKLYVGQKGKDIEHADSPEEVKKGKRQTFYQLPKGEKPEEKPVEEPVDEPSPEDEEEV